MNTGGCYIRRTLSYEEVKRLDEFKKVVSAIDDAFSLVFGEDLPEKDSAITDDYPNLLPY